MNPYLHRLKIFALICAVTLFGSCASDIDIPERSVLTPVPQNIVDPSDFVLKQSMSKILKQANAPLNSGYIHRRIDLNDDGRRDALILFKTPYGFWCGTHGCTMFIMQAHNDHFTLVNDVQTVRPPIYISQEKTNGWKNIILRISGRRTSSKNVAMQYDRNAYPKYPDSVARISAQEDATKVKVFN